MTRRPWIIEWQKRDGLWDALNGWRRYRTPADRHRLTQPFGTEAKAGAWAAHLAVIHPHHAFRVRLRDEEEK